MKTLQRDSQASLNGSTPVADSPKPLTDKQPAKHPSEMTHAWVDQMLTGAKRMHQDEAYRKTIAQKLS